MRVFFRGLLSFNIFSLCSRYIRVTSLQLFFLSAFLSKDQDKLCASPYLLWSCSAPVNPVPTFEGNSHLLIFSMTDLPFKVDSWLEGPNNSDISGFANFLKAPSLFWLSWLFKLAADFLYRGESCIAAEARNSDIAIGSSSSIITFFFTSASSLWIWLAVSAASNSSGPFILKSVRFSGMGVSLYWESTSAGDASKFLWMAFFVKW